MIHDPLFDLLHINLGAVGITGIHTIRTAIRFTIGGKEKMSDFQVVEFGDKIQKRSW